MHSNLLLGAPQFSGQYRRFEVVQESLDSTGCRMFWSWPGRAPDRAAGVTVTMGAYDRPGSRFG